MVLVFDIVIMIFWMVDIIRLLGLVGVVIIVFEIVRWDIDVVG